MPKIGDIVTFHVLHTPGEPMWACPAVVVDVYPQPGAAEVAAAGAASLAAQTAEAKALGAVLAAPGPEAFAALAAASEASALAAAQLAAVQAAAAQPLALVLDVTFPAEAFALQDAAGARAAHAVTLTLPTLGDVTALAAVTDGGFVSRQSHAAQATTEPPASGTWTP